MTDKLKKIILNDKRYKNFTILPDVVKFKDLFINQNFGLVQLHSTQTYNDGNTENIVGFCGVFEWKNNEVIPLDGDSYTENTDVIGYNFFTDEDNQICLDILVGENW